MIHTMNMSIANRTVQMAMDLDPTNRCDAGIIDCCQHGEAELEHAAGVVLAAIVPRSTHVSITNRLHLKTARRKQDS